VTTKRERASTSQLTGTILRLSTLSREMLKTMKHRSAVSIIGSRFFNIKKAHGYLKQEKELFL